MANSLPIMIDAFLLPIQEKIICANKTAEIAILAGTAQLMFCCIKSIMCSTIKTPLTSISNEEGH